MLYIDITKPLVGAHGEMNLEISLQIEQGTFMAIMGESGAGKTTLLRILAGLEDAKGLIEVDGTKWLSSTHKTTSQKRGIGFVFQDYALFENMSVEENLLFVNNDKAFAKELLALAGLTQLSTRHMHQLSGGQKQRVSLCRAMMHKPKLLLLDEPFSALDEKMKSQLSSEIAKFHKRFGMTTIMVSHDANNSYALASRVVVLKEGKIINDGTVDEVFKKSTQVVYHI